MPLRLVPTATTRQDHSSNSDTTRARWTCAFVNNMPDGAFNATERQYLDLLAEGSSADVVEVRRYAMAGVPRGVVVADKIAAEYAPLAAIYAEVPDLLIVTGSNPVEVRIQDEPYWDNLLELLPFARDHVQSSLLSCLSAHAATAIFDGVERSRLDAKCAGVFRHTPGADHPLSDGLDADLVLPHSRTNTVHENAMLEAGYRIALRSPDVGWAVATKDFANTSVVLVQGHPEYEPSSLLREYRRDAGRYVHRERDDPPVLPVACAAPADFDDLERRQRALIEGQRDPDLIDTFPFDEAAERAPWPWRETAKRLYVNWMNGVNIDPSVSPGH